MTFILAPERDIDPLGAFARYRTYIESVRTRFPPGALALATSDWYFDASDHRSPHDAWLEEAIFEETSSGSPQESRQLSLRIRLLGAYHDLALELRYSGVVGYRLEGNHLAKGHADWRYDELRLSDSGLLVHEIQWSGARDTASWLIESHDVTLAWRELKGHL